MSWEDASSTCLDPADRVTTTRTSIDSEGSHPGMLYILETSSGMLEIQATRRELRRIFTTASTIPFAER